MKKAYEHSHHGHTGTTRHSPRNGFTAYFALSSVTTLFDTVACASSRRLDANDWGVGTTRLRRTQQSALVSRAAASTASRPAFVTIASRPSIGTGQRGYTTDLGRPASIISEIQKLIEAPGAGKKARPGGPTEPRRRAGRTGATGVYPGPGEKKRRHRHRASGTTSSDARTSITARSLPQ